MNHRQLIAAAVTAVLASASCQAGAAENLDQIISDQTRAAQRQIHQDMRRSLRQSMHPLLPEVPFASAATEPVAVPTKVSCPVTKPDGTTYSC